jgi:putative flippase GtrA
MMRIFRIWLAGFLRSRVARLKTLVKISVYKGLSLITQKIISYFQLHRDQILRFGIVGVVTFILNYTLVWLFYGLFAMDYRVAVTFAYVITVVIHFILNRTFTYKKGESFIMGHLGKYGGMLAVNYFIMLSVSMSTVELCRLTPYHGIVFATCVTAFSSFFLMKYFVFCD